MKIKYLFFIPLLIGVIGGFSAIFIRDLIDVSNRYIGIFAIHHSIWYIVIIPAVFVLSAYIINIFLTDTTNPTIDTVAKGIVLQKGRLDYKKGFLAVLVTSLNIGAGTPVGREGPIAKLGGSLSYLFLNIFHVRGKYIPLYVTCGVTSALGATFNAPISAVVFGIEIILGKLSLNTVIPLVVSSATATLISREILGDYPTFFVKHLFYNEQLMVLLPLFAVAFTLTVIFYETLKLKIEEYFKNFAIYKKALIGGLIVGGFLVFFPQAASIGYSEVSNLFAQHYIAPHTFLLAFVKTIILAVTIGIGLFGGIFAPSIFIGAFLGYFLGKTILPNEALSVALIGAAALTAGMSHAPFRSSLIIIELTKNYQLSIPILLTSVVTAYLVAYYNDKFYHRAVLQYGFDLSNKKLRNYLKTLKAKEFLRKDVFVVDENTTLKDIINDLLSNSAGYFPVVKENRLTGIISFRDIRNAKNLDVKIKEIMTPHPHFLTLEDDGIKMFEIYSDVKTSLIPVVDNKKTQHYIGMCDIEKFKKYVSLLYVQT